MFSEQVVGRVLHQDTAEVGLGTEVARGYAGVDGCVGPLGGLEGTVAAIPNVGEARYAHAGGLRENRNQVRTDHQVAGLHTAVGEAVHHFTRRPAGTGALLQGTDALVHLRGPFQTFRSKGGYIEGVVVETGEGQSQLVV